MPSSAPRPWQRFATGFSGLFPAPSPHLDRYVTDEQRSSRPIFNATLRAAASWLFFCVARSTVMIQIAALRSCLEKQPTDLRRSSRDLGDGTLVGKRPEDSRVRLGSFTVIASPTAMDHKIRFIRSCMSAFCPTSKFFYRRSGASSG